MVPRTDDVVRFYQAAHLGLLALDARSTRKRLSGAEAEGRWAAFSGDMNDWDRLELCLRDAAVQFPAAFAPRVIFALDGLTDDEPFGDRWQRPAGQLAWKLLHEPPATPASLDDLISSAARVWGLPLPEAPVAGLDDITVATRVRVAGAGALVAVARRLARIDASNLIDQVTLITDAPAERQLFGLAGVFMKASGEARLAGSQSAPGKGTLGELVIVSPDASEEAARAARAPQRPGKPGELRGDAVADGARG
jgi:hypothetical protein